MGEEEEHENAKKGKKIKWRGKKEKEYHRRKKTENGEKMRVKKEENEKQGGGGEGRRPLTSAASEVVGHFLVQTVGVGLLAGEVCVVLVEHIVYRAVRLAQVLKDLRTREKYTCN